MPGRAERKGKHITTACDQCRRMKVRCDAASPRCSNCLRLKHDCTYLRGPDRRKVSKVAASQLINRVLLLEDTLRKHNIPVPVPTSTLDCHAYLVRRQGPSQAPPSPDQHPRSTHLGSLGHEIGTYSHRLDGRTTIPTTQHLGGCIDDELDQLSKRLGSLRVAEDGQLRYYGATSNMHLLNEAPGPQADSAPFCGYDADTCLAQAGVGHTVPRELEDHLIGLYFAWENPFIHVVDEDVFLNTRARTLSQSTTDPKSQSPYYNQVLVNAMCSIGSAFTDRIILELPSPLAEFFGRRARVLLDADMDSPSVATVQALVIMSAHEAAVMRDARGWLYSGMAMRLAVDLALHMDPDPYVKKGTMDQHDVVARRVAFWGTFLVDLGWSYYVGRLTMHINLDGVTVPKPSHKSGKSRAWTHYTDEAIQPFNEPAPRQYPDTIDHVLEHQVSLYVIMAQLQKIFNDIKLHSRGIVNSSTKKVTRDLIHWRQSLPPEISTESIFQSSITLPHTLLLHMQYHEVMIFANHPLIAGASGAMTTDIREGCAESARAIALILQIYKQQWSLRRMNIQGVHMIFSATLVHLLLSCTSEDSSTREAAVNDLKVCCEALKELSIAFRSATRALDSIAKTKEKWQASLDNPDMDTTLKTYFQVQQPISDPKIWQAVDEVICQEQNMHQSDPQLDDVSWLDGWMAMQAMTADPFALGLA
ncbi:fungal specific transcription factor [Coccidioides immitis RS]|uniref:Fungal specific transcription factor n=1 Tax=Coccidioides immitis (strain RS) TaxID=246410 RepID=A0A0E1S0A0_COCIM|nr:fungal specific transcription factor [Coccidioides immitis RS]EAS35971.2 fungal specific transcription factor [Coccidioides immitis RS]